MAKKILVVDDEKDLVKTIVFRLEANGYKALTAYDGEEGLKKARTEKPDLIILDLMLPNIDGYKVCETLKSDEAYSSIPIIILSARAQYEDIEMTKKVGANAYITKPFEPSALLAKIKQFLED